MAADPVLAERQQISQVFELPSTPQLQAEPACRRHRNPERRRGKQQGYRAGEDDRIAFEPRDLPFQIDISSVPLTLDAKTQRRKTRMCGGGERKPARVQGYMAPRRAQGSVERCGDCQSASCFGVA